MQCSVIRPIVSACLSLRGFSSMYSFYYNITHTSNMQLVVKIPGKNGIPQLFDLRLIDTSQKWYHSVIEWLVLFQIFHQNNNKKGNSAQRNIGTFLNSGSLRVQKQKLEHFQRSGLHTSKNLLIKKTLYYNISEAIELGWERLSKVRICIQEEEIPK